MKIMNLLIGLILLNFSSHANVITKSKIDLNDVSKSVQTLQKDLLKDIKANQNNCEVLRDQMDVLIDYLQYDPIFIVGKNGKYYREGMHEEFISDPKPMDEKYNDARLPMALQLELTHIDLYHCDKHLFQQITRFKHLKDYISHKSLTELTNILTKKYQDFPNWERPKNKNKKRAWIKETLMTLSELTPVIPMQPQLSDQRIIKETVENTLNRNQIAYTYIEKEIPSFTISPNPNNGLFNIKVSFKTETNIKLQILDIQGRLIWKEEQANQLKYEQQFRLKDIATGIYYVQLFTNGKSFQKAIVIE